LRYFGDDYRLIGQEGLKINNIASLDRGGDHDISFCSSDDKEGLECTLNSKSDVILCNKTLQIANSIRNTFEISNRLDPNLPF
jgi:hypothetical protein